MFSEKIAPSITWARFIDDSEFESLKHFYHPPIKEEKVNSQGEGERLIAKRSEKTLHSKFISENDPKTIIICSS